MKKISILALSVLITGTVVFVGCSSEESISTVENTSSAKRFGKGDLDDFISDFYNTSFVYGDSIVAYDSIANLMVKEIIVGSDTKARGYVAIDETSKEPLYFMDVDRYGDELKTIDLDTEETDVFTDISSHDDYLLSGKFDMIQVIDDLNNNAVTYAWINLPKFWGKDHPKVGPKKSGIIPNSDPEELGCWVESQPTVRRFFIRFESGKPKILVIPC